MARPKLHGPTISLTVPLQVHSWLLRRANAQGVSVGVYVQRTLVRAAVRDGALTAEEAAEQPTGHEKPANACEHKDFVLIAGGLRRCKSCDQVRGADGGWR